MTEIEKMMVTRVLVIEEIAQWFSERSNEHYAMANVSRDKGDDLKAVSQASAYAAMRAAADYLRSSNPIPPHLVAVPRETVVKARATIGHALEFLAVEYGNDQGNDWGDEQAAEVGDALEACLAELPRGQDS